MPSRPRNTTVTPPLVADAESGLAAITASLSGGRSVPDDIAEMLAEQNSLTGDIGRIGNQVSIANHVPTGCAILDIALLGGIPEGYATMLYGYASTAKTLTSLHTVANYQSKHPNKWAAIVDVEGLYDPLWAKKQGVDTERLLVYQPTTGEQAVNLLDDLVTRQSVGIAVLDTIATCTPSEVLDRAAEDKTMGALAALMGNLCSKMIVGMNRRRMAGNPFTLITLNQFRDDIGKMFGDKRKLPGGRQINHMPTTKIELALLKTQYCKDENGVECVDYTEQAFRLTKNKHGGSIPSGEFQVQFRPGQEVAEGHCHNAHQAVAFAKLFGFYVAKGNNRAVTGLTATFRTDDELEAHLNANTTDYNKLMQAIIRRQREMKGLPELPPDGWLYFNK